MKEELISVIVPVYNVEKYLEKCVKSIINQTYKNLEIILVDDGATDNSGKICDELSKTDSRIKVIHKENGGLSDARNFGLDIATGDYIAFIDSDDYINKKYFEILFTEIKRKDYDIAMCDYKKFIEDEFVDESINEKYKTEEHSKYSILDLYYDVGHKHEKAVVAWGKLYKAKFFKTLRYPKGKRGEDELTHYKIYNQAECIIEIKEKLLYYLTRKGSLSSDWYTKPRHYMVEAFEEELEYFVKNKEPKIVHMIVNRLLRELKHNYNFKLKSTEKYGEMFIKYYKQYKEKIEYNQAYEEFYLKIIK